MQRVDKTEGTPKKRQQELDENIINKDAITKSGRKVKRPAHLDSPERPTGAPVPDARKSVARKTKTAHDAVDSPVKVTPGKRALPKAGDSADENRGARKTVGSTRKTIATQVDTPKGETERAQGKKLLPDAADESSVSKSGRKIKVPSKLIDFDSELVSSPRKTTVSGEEVVKSVQHATVKTPGRPPKSAKKRAADDDTVQRPDTEPATERVGRGRSVAVKEGGNSTPRKAAATTDSYSEAAAARTLSPAPAPPKTPGRRGKSVVPTKPSVAAPEEEENKTALKTGRTPGRPAGGKSLMKLHPDTPVPPKTPGRRGKSLAPPKQDVEESIAPVEEETKKVTKTPARTPGGRRAGKSLMASAVEPAMVSESGEARPLEEEEPLSRTGRKIKPKKIFEIDQEEGAKKPQSEDATDSVGGGRKRKLDIADDGVIEGMISPRKKAVIQSVAATKQDQSGAGAQPPESLVEEPYPELILKKHTHTEKTSVPVVAASPAKAAPPAGGTEGLVSRSGRKIKAKKMFGFEDGDFSGATESLFGIVSSPAKETSAHGQTPKGGKTASQPPEKSSEHPQSQSEKPSAVPNIVVVQATKVEEEEKKRTAVEKTGAQWDKFITKRGVDDHHGRRTVPQLTTTATDEPDRAFPASVRMPNVLRTSFVSSPGLKVRGPSGVKLVKTGTESSPPESATVEQTAEPQPEEVAVAAPVEPAGGNNSRSGRKIKQKKFFDDDFPNLTLGQAGTVKEGKKSSADAAVKGGKEHDVSLAPTIVRAEERTTTHSVAVTNSEAENPPESGPKGDDIAEGPTACSAPMDTSPLPADTPAPADETMDIQSDEQANDGNTNATTHSDVDVPEAKESMVVVAAEGIDVTEGPTTIEGEKEDENPSNNVATAAPTGEPDVQTHATGDETEIARPTEVLVPSSKSLAEVEVVDVPANDPKFESEEVLQSFTSNYAVSDDLATDEKGATSESAGFGESFMCADGESTIEELKVDDDLLLDECSFGEIEYLEDEVPNIVEHIKKSTSRPGSRAALERTDDDDAAIVPGPNPAVPNIAIIPKTPLPKMDATFSPVKPLASAVVIDITADTPQAMPKQPRHHATPVATAARTPDAKASGRHEGHDKCSPDKPPEIIDITDSPAEMAFCQQIVDACGAAETGGTGSATSTPLVVLKKRALHVLQHEGRKRSLSASAADTTMKRNVTFHSPANSTVLVDAIDERLIMKSLQQKEGEKSSTKRGGPRKRSMSEHKPAPEEEDPKPSKISRKVPNFRNIHANHFNRMESIADFMKRKEQRAKIILTSASPATKLLARPATAVAETGDVTSTDKKAHPAQKPFVFKSGGGGIPVPSASLFGNATSTSTATGVIPRPQKATNIARPVVSAASRAAALARKQKTNPITDTETRMTNRLQQYQASFKPKQNASEETSTGTTTASSSSSSTTRPVNQLRTKQSKILKGVRTNRRFELQMKHRDNNP